MESNTEIKKQCCPICSKDVRPSLRYANYVCSECVPKATDENGQLVGFVNEDISGGCVGVYIGSQQLYSKTECFINGIKCKAQEARFGGIVIQPINTEE